ncbi:MAG: hypothetical protein IPN90_13320 [Elusimicrobia bacterium]|nr:hypothetical protein [Elusimicrobiota bacterium]
MDVLVHLPAATGHTRQVFGAKNGQLDLMFQESLQENPGTEVPGRTRSTSLTTTFYRTDDSGRAVSAYGVSESMADDGYGNLTRGRTAQLMSSIDGEMKLMATVSDNILTNLDGSDNRTTMVTVNGYTGDGKLITSQGAGYYNGHEAGLTNPEQVWVDGWTDLNGDGAIGDDEVDFARADGIMGSDEILWVDDNKDGRMNGATVEVGGVSHGTIDQTFVVIGLEAKLVSSKTVGGVVQLSGSVSQQETTTEYHYDPEGRLLFSKSFGLTGGITKGLSDSDDPPDGVDDETVVDVATTSGTQEQTFVIINGQAKLKTSKATSETVTPTGVSQSELTTDYLYNEHTGALLGAYGRGTQAGIERGLTDASFPPDGVALTEIVLSRNTGTVEQYFEVVNGQSKLLKSITTTVSLDPGTGAELQPEDDRYSRSVTTSDTINNGLGQVRASSSKTKTELTSYAWTQKDSNGDGVIDKEDDVTVGERRIQPVVSETINAMSLVKGQALVGKSITKNWTASLVNGTFIKVDDPRVAGYSFNETTVNYHYNSIGLLSEANGTGRGHHTTEVWSQEDTNGDGKINGDDDRTRGRREQVFSVYQSVNTYVILVGQAQVMEAVTETWGAQFVGATFKKIEDSSAHGYNRTVTTVYNKYNESGQLEAVKGGSTGRTNVEVLTQVEGKADEWVDQLTETMTTNVYAVVRGQAVVLMSVTESWSVGSDGRRIVDSTAHGYSHSVTTVVNQYNVDGQLIGARGWTETLSTQGAFRSVDDWRGALLGGEEVVVVFDETGDKFDDEVYGGVGDPLGRLKGGETYRVVYGGGRTRTMGHDQATGQEGMEDEENGMIDGGRLVLWGEAFEVSEGGEVQRQCGAIGGTPIERDRVERDGLGDCGGCEPKRGAGDGRGVGDGGAAHVVANGEPVCGDSGPGGGDAQ